MGEGLGIGIGEGGGVRGLVHRLNDLIGRQRVSAGDTVTKAIFTRSI